MHRFEDDRYYVTTDADLELVGTPYALAKQRSRGEGARYHKVGKRILYLGRDLNAYLDACLIEPTTGPAVRSESAAPAERAAQRVAVN